jgi:hypothetical protein
MDAEEQGAVMSQVSVRSPGAGPAVARRVRVARTSDGNDDPVRFASADGSELQASETVAHRVLEHWQWAVQEASSTAPSDETRTALRRLALWYERMCADEMYKTAAPADGLDALMAGEREPDSFLCRRVVVTHWAIRVAQELARFRRRGAEGDGDTASSLLAHAQLDLALRGAFDRLGRPGSTSVTR